ncbi:MAG: hypothetical protein MJK04_23515, partial [Psychrosphaera sp.]|nr:hypothetical protein [Psychrosphaera sp.]
YYFEYAKGRSGESSTVTNLPVGHSPLVINPENRPVMSIYTVPKSKLWQSHGIYHQINTRLIPMTQFISVSEQNIVVKAEKQQLYGIKGTTQNLTSKRKRSDILIKSKQLRLFIEVSNASTVNDQFEAEVYVAILDLVAERPLVVRAFFNRADSAMMLQQKLTNDIATYAVGFAQAHLQ